MLTIQNRLQNGIMINFCITFKSIQVYSSNYSINIDRTYHINNAFNSGVMKHELIWLIYSCQAELADGKAIVKNLKRLISPTFVGQRSVFPRDASLPSSYGFPDFSSVQCDNESQLSLFWKIVFILESNPTLVLSSFTPKITFLC